MTQVHESNKYTTQTTEKMTAVSLEQSTHAIFVTSVTSYSTKCNGLGVRIAFFDLRVYSQELANE